MLLGRATIFGVGSVGTSGMRLNFAIGTSGTNSSNVHANIWRESRVGFTVDGKARSTGNWWPWATVRSKGTRMPPNGVGF